MVFICTTSLFMSSCMFFKKNTHSGSGVNTQTAVKSLKNKEVVRENMVTSKIVIPGIGIGPIKDKIEVSLQIDESKAQQGMTLFGQKCSACHKIEEKYVGPALKGVTKRRQPEWILNMIMNPVEMTQKDEVAKELLAEHLTQMTYQNVDIKEAYAILEYFRLEDSR